ncbi:MAG: hypothetical protein OXI12_13960 [Gammaproteobacteria bacterium]|nr:hypothetical protein [Gammaproteobacteria bacterium]
MTTNGCAHCGKPTTGRRKYCNQTCINNARRRSTKSTALRAREPKWVPVFLEAFAKCGVVTFSAAHAGVTRSAVYKRRERDPRFEERFVEAEAEAADVIRLEYFRRGHTGWQEPVFQGGEQVGVIRRYSDRLLMALGSARCPELNPRHKVDLSGSVALDWDEESQALLEKLHAMGTGEGSGAQRLANALAEAGAEAVVDDE